MQNTSLLLSLVLLGLSSSSSYVSCAFIPSKSRDPGTASKFIDSEAKASFVFGNLTTSTTATTTTPTSLPSLDETVTSNFESLEFSPTEISAQNPKCSPGGYPCTPDIVKMKLRNNSMYTSKAYQEPTPCCSGVCQYEEGWIDATCE